MSQNRRACPACAERYPLQNGLHELPGGDVTPCDQDNPFAIYRKIAPQWPGFICRKIELPQVASGGSYL